MAGHLEPLAGDPLAGDPHAGDPQVFMPNILAALLISESESRNWLIVYSQKWPESGCRRTAMVIAPSYQIFWLSV